MEVHTAGLSAKFCEQKSNMMNLQILHKSAKSEQLVNIYLALSTLCDFKMALFIVGSYETAGVMSTVESLLIDKEVIANKKSYKNAALAFGVNKTTLYRLVQKMMHTVAEGNSNDTSLVPRVVSGYARPRQLFSDDDDQLVTHLTDESKMFWFVCKRDT